jgi:hypothetical protein
MAKLCPICNLSIVKGDSIAVLSYPLTAMNDDGDYGFLLDFFNNERVIHFDCLNLQDVNVESVPKTQDHSVVRELFQMIKAIDKNIKGEHVVNFVNAHADEKDIKQLFYTWFKERNNVA